MADMTELQANLEVARSVLMELGERLGRNEFVDREERRRINQEYQAAEAAVNVVLDAERRTVVGDVEPTLIRVDGIAPSVSFYGE